MAQNTAVNISFQARDWELLIGWLGNTGDSDMGEIVYSLQSLYKTQPIPKPTGNDPVAIASTEGVAVKIFEQLYNATLKFVARDGSPSPFTRITAAIRGLNNVADNYISTSIAALEANYNTVYINTRKRGRALVMMNIYDNN